MQIAERREIITSINSTTISSEKEGMVSEEDERFFLEPKSSLPDDMDTPSSSIVEPVGSSLTDYARVAANKYDDVMSKSDITLPPKRYLDSDSKEKIKGKTSEKATTYELPPFVSEISTTYESSKDTDESILHHLTDDADVTIDEDVKSPPLAGPNVMNVILVAAECAPWSKTGTMSNDIFI